MGGYAPVVLADVAVVLADVAVVQADVAVVQGEEGFAHDELAAEGVVAAVRVQVAALLSGRWW